MTRTALALSIALLIVGACQDSKKPNSGDKQQGGSATSRPVPAGGCDQNFEDLLQWAAEVLEFKMDYDGKYVREPLSPDKDIEWLLTGAGVVRKSVDDKGAPASADPVAYDKVASGDIDKLVKEVMKTPTGTAWIQVDDGVEWQHVVTAIAAVKRLGYSKAKFLVPGQIQIPKSPEPSSIRPQLVELANQDDRLFEDKDEKIIATVFEHCPPVLEEFKLIKGPNRLFRFRGFLDLVKAGMRHCECRADLGEVKESIWVRAMLSPYIVRQLQFTISREGDGPSEKLEFAATDDWKTVQKGVVELHDLVGEKDPKLVLFELKK